MFAHILVPLDGSEVAEHVLPQVKELAAKFDSQVTLLRAIPSADEYIAAAEYGNPATPLSLSPMDPLVSGTLVTDPNEVIDAAKATANDYLKNVAAQFGAGVKVQGVVPEGAPNDAIITWAASNNVDLIALTTHGRSGLDRMIMGSVADQVVRKSSCPVLLVRVHGT